MFNINLSPSIIRFELVLNKHSQKHPFSSMRHVPSRLRNLKRGMEGKVREKTFIFFHRIRGEKAARALKE